MTTNNEDDLERTAHIALGEVLNLAAMIADLQTDDEGADSIYGLCDFVAAYYGITRHVQMMVEDDEGNAHLEWVDLPPGEITVSTPLPPTPAINTSNAKYRFSSVEVDPGESDADEI